MFKYISTPLILMVVALSSYLTQESFPIYCEWARKSLLFLLPLSVAFEAVKAVSDEEMTGSKDLFIGIIIAMSIVIYYTLSFSIGLFPELRQDIFFNAASFTAVIDAFLAPLLAKKIRSR